MLERRESHIYVGVQLTYKRGMKTPKSHENILMKNLLQGDLISLFALLEKCVKNVSPDNVRRSLSRRPRGGGHPDKVFPFLPGIYLAAR